MVPSEDATHSVPMLEKFVNLVNHQNMDKRSNDGPGEEAASFRHEVFSAPPAEQSKDNSIHRGQTEISKFDPIVSVNDEFIN